MGKPWEKLGDGLDSDCSEAQTGQIGLRWEALAGAGWQSGSWNPNFTGGCRGWFAVFEAPPEDARSDSSSPEASPFSLLGALWAELALQKDQGPFAGVPRPPERDGSGCQAAAPALP